MACQCDSEGVGCLCTFTGGLNVVVTGGGSSADPVRIDVEAAYLEGVDGDNTLVTVTGTGDVADPYLVNIQVDPALGEGLWTRWSGTRAAYDAIPSKDPGTLYVVIP
jgi:hypothetical protein